MLETVYSETAGEPLQALVGEQSVKLTEIQRSIPKLGGTKEYQKKPRQRPQILTEATLCIMQPQKSRFPSARLPLCRDNHSPQIFP